MKMYKKKLKNFPITSKKAKNDAKFKCCQNKNKTKLKTNKQTKQFNVSEPFNKEEKKNIPD